MGNVELFELCETIPKVQCSECLLYWNQVVIYCTCGHLLKESEASQHFHQWRLDAFSIENNVIKKVRPRGARHGKIEAQKEHFVAHNARKRCIKKKFEGIHDRFLRDPVFRDSQLESDWTEAKCIAMDKLAQEDHSYRLSLLSHTEQIGQECPDETPIRLPNRSHINEPSSPRIGEEGAEPIPFQQYQRWHPVFFQFFMVAVGRNWWSSFYQKNVVVGSFTADSNLLQPTGV